MLATAAATAITVRTDVPTLSQKKSPTFLAVTRESTVGFSQCLAQKLPRKSAISGCYSFLPHLTSVSALSAKMQ